MMCHERPDVLHRPRETGRCRELQIACRKGELALYGLLSANHILQ